MLANSMPRNLELQLPLCLFQVLSFRGASHLLAQNREVKDLLHFILIYMHQIKIANMLDMTEFPRLDKLVQDLASPTSPTEVASAIRPKRVLMDKTFTPLLSKVVSDSYKALSVN